MAFKRSRVRLPSAPLCHSLGLPGSRKVGNGLRAALQAEVAQDALQLIHERLPLPDHRVQAPPLTVHLGTASVRTPSGNQQQSLHPCQIASPGTPIPPLDFNAVTGSQLAAQGLAALVGRDVLRHFLMIYNGVDGIWTLSFWRVYQRAPDLFGAPSPLLAGCLHPVAYLDGRMSRGVRIEQCFGSRESVVASRPWRYMSGECWSDSDKQRACS